LVNKRNLLHEAREWSYPDETPEATVNPPPSTPAVRADTRERVPVIDIGIALDLLTAAMQQRGPVRPHLKCQYLWYSVPAVC
jgi:hypothetical protein